MNFCSLIRQIFGSYFFVCEKINLFVTKIFMCEIKKSSPVLQGWLITVSVLQYIIMAAFGQKIVGLMSLTAFRSGNRTVCPSLLKFNVVTRGFSSWSMLTWQHHTAAADEPAAHPGCDSPIPRNPKGALLDWDLVTVKATGVQWSHYPVQETSLRRG